MYMICRDQGDIFGYVCSAHPATKQAAISGIKFWCQKHGRWVIPDKNHILRFREHGEWKHIGGE